MSENGAILKSLIEQDFGITGNGRWFRSEEHSSLVLDYEKGIFFFNAENIVGDPLVYLTKVRGYEFDQAKEYLRGFNYNGTFVYSIKAGKEDVVVYPKLVETFYELGKDKEKRDYFYRRGLTDDTIDRFSLGWYNDYNFIPFFEDGTFRNFQMRRDIPTKRIKSYYKNIGPLLFNGDILKIVDRVFITEGPVDALILIQNGLSAISTNTGGFISPDWYSKFIRVKDIYILFDRDKAGDKESVRVANMLGKFRCKIYNFWDFDEPTYDPVNFFEDGKTKDDLLELIEKKGKYVFEGV